MVRAGVGLATGLRRCAAQVKVRAGDGLMRARRHERRATMQGDVLMGSHLLGSELLQNRVTPATDVAGTYTVIYPVVAGGLTHGTLLHVRNRGVVRAPHDSSLVVVERESEPFSC